MNKSKLKILVAAAATALFDGFLFTRVLSSLVASRQIKPDLVSYLLPVFFLLIIPVLLICLGDWLGSFTGRLGSQTYVDTPTPGWIIAGFGWILLLLPIAFFAYYSFAIATPAAKRKPNLNIAIKIDQATLGHSDLGKILTLNVTVKNTSRSRVQYEIWPPSDGIILYIVSNDGKKTPVYPFDPFNPLIFDLRHVEKQFLAPGMSSSYKINISCTNYPLLRGNIVASVNVFHSEAFSEPFELPDLK